MDNESRKNRASAIESKGSARNVKEPSVSMGRPVSIKIAYVGGGSTGWAHILMNDLATTTGLTGEVALYDLDFGASLLNERFGNLLQTMPGVVSRFKYRAVPRLADALMGADFVVCSITPAPLSYMRYDVDIPQKYGIFQTVGDTVGPGGIMRAMRAIPIYEGFAHAFMRYCPRAWIINYTNPMTVLTRTLTKVEPHLKVFGCCHEVFGTQSLLGLRVAKKYKVPKPPREEIQVNVMGINHFTWVDKATWKGRDLLKLVREEMQRKGARKRFTPAQMARQLKENNGLPWGIHNNQIVYELFERFTILPAAGERHLAEFLPGFCGSAAEVNRWGIVQTPIDFRLKNKKHADVQRLEALRKKKILIEASGEEGVLQMKALLGLGSFITNVNVENQGQIPNLPRNAVVETNARFSRNSVKPINAGPLPAGVLGLVERHVRGQELIVEGALKRDLGLCFQAFCADPLVTCPMDKAHEMFERMVAGTRAFLKGYK